MRRVRHFMLTGYKAEMKTELSHQIQSLGGVYTETEHILHKCTHIVCKTPSRSEKFLGGLASGKWLLTTDYIKESYRHGRWLAEEDYEWSSKWLHLLPETLDARKYLGAPAKWRKQREQSKLGPFAGWRVFVLVEQKKKSVYKRLLQMGSAEVLDVTLPIKDADALALQLTHVFLEDKFASQVQCLATRGVQCLQPLYMGAYLLMEFQDPLAYKISFTDKRNLEVTKVEVKVEIDTPPSSQEKDGQPQGTKRPNSRSFETSNGISTGGKETKAVGMETKVLKYVAEKANSRASSVCSDVGNNRRRSRKTNSQPGSRRSSISSNIDPTEPATQPSQRSTTVKAKTHLVVNNHSEELRTNRKQGRSDSRRSSVSSEVSDPKAGDIEQKGRRQSSRQSSRLSEREDSRPGSRESSVSSEVTNLTAVANISDIGRCQSSRISTLKAGSSRSSRSSSVSSDSNDFEAGSSTTKRDRDRKLSVRIDSLERPMTPDNASQERPMTTANGPECSQNTPAVTPHSTQTGVTPELSFRTPGMPFTTPVKSTPVKTPVSSSKKKLSLHTKENSPKLSAKGRKGKKIDTTGIRSMLEFVTCTPRAKKEKQLANVESIPLKTSTPKVPVIPVEDENAGPSVYSTPVGYYSPVRNESSQDSIYATPAVPTPGVRPSQGGMTVRCSQSVPAIPGSVPKTPLTGITGTAVGPQARRSRRLETVKTTPEKYRKMLGKRIVRRSSSEKSQTSVSDDVPATDDDVIITQYVPSAKKVKLKFESYDIQMTQTGSLNGMKPDVVCDVRPSDNIAEVAVPELSQVSPDTAIKPPVTNTKPHQTELGQSLESNLKVICYNEIVPKPNDTKPTTDNDTEPTNDIKNFSTEDNVAKASATSGVNIPSVVQKDPVKNILSPVVERSPVKNIPSVIQKGPVKNIVTSVVERSPVKNCPSSVENIPSPVTQRFPVQNKNVSIKRKLSYSMVSSAVKKAKLDKDQMNESGLVVLSQQEKVCLPLPLVMTALFEAPMDEDKVETALDMLSMFMSASYYPTEKVLQLLSQKGFLESQSSEDTDEVYACLQQLLLLHPPATPTMQQVYLATLQQPQQDATPGQHWDDLLNSLSGVVGGEDNISVYTGIRLFLFVTSLLEKDFTCSFSSVDSRAKSKLQQCLISQLLWPSGQVGIFNTRCQQLLNLFGEVVLLGTEDIRPQWNISKVELLKPLLRLATMIGEVCYVVGKRSQSHFIEDTPRDAKVLACKLAFCINEAKDNELLELMLTSIEAAWIRIIVTETLLGNYDSSLIDVPAGPASITLDSIVRQCMFLLPASAHGISTPVSSRNSSTCNKPPANTPSKHLAIAYPMSAAQRRKVTTINKRDAKGETALHKACIKNQVAKVKELLATPGIDVNMKDNVGWTPLHEAANRGHSDCVKELLNFKPANTIMSYFRTGNKGCVNLLAAAEDGITPLHDAVMNNHVQVAILLLQKGGTRLLEAKMDDGKTPLDLVHETMTDMRDALMSNQHTDATTKVLRPKHFFSESQNIELSFSQQSQSSMCSEPDYLAPSDDLYSQVLGTEGQTKTVSHNQCVRMVLLIQTLCEAYLSFYGLQTLALTLAEDQGHSSHNQTESRQSNKADDPKDATDQDSFITRLFNDLKMCQKMKFHLDDFKHHLLRITGGTNLDFCKARLKSLECLFTIVQ